MRNKNLYLHSLGGGGQCFQTMFEATLDNIGGLNLFSFHLLIFFCKTFPFLFSLYDLILELYGVGGGGRGSVNIC